MDWLSLVAAALAAVRAFLQWLVDTRRIDAAVAEAVLKGMRESDDAIRKAQAARAGVRADLERNPAGLRDDDGFRRDAD